MAPPSSGECVKTLEVFEGPRNHRSKAALSSGHVQVPRAVDLVTERIRELIVTGRLADGERLPSLDGLLAEFGISGPTMREALRMLESEGLITVQRGKVGGAIVHRPSYTDAATTMALVLRSHDTEIADVARSLRCSSASARSCAPAGRTARRRSCLRFQELNETTGSLVHADEITFTEAMTAFHEELQCAVADSRRLALATRAVGAISSNPRAAMGGRERCAGQIRHLRGTSRMARTPAELVDRIEAGDEAGVEQMMTEHFSTVQILGNGLDPEQMIDAHAVHADRTVGAAEQAGWRHTTHFSPGQSLS